MFSGIDNILGGHSADSGYPVGAGYPRFGLESKFGVDSVPPDLASGAEVCLRVLTLRTRSCSKKTLSFSAADLRSVLSVLTGPPGSVGESVVASCDHKRVKGPPAHVHVSVLLKATLGVNPDFALAQGVRALFASGATTTKGVKLEVVSYGNPVRDAKPAARVCRVVTRSSVDTVRQALVDRGLPVEAILRIATPGSGDLCHSNVVLVHLHPSFPVSGIPWKLPLMEPGYGLAPRKLSVQGACCVVCRSSDHRQSQCEFSKKTQCGRCGFPLEKLAEAGVDTHLHDCEGGPTGLGVEHLDPLGSAWHQALLGSRPKLVEAEVDDPLAEVRSASLEAARALAEQAKRGPAQRKRPPPSTPTGLTPDNQHQKLVQASPLTL